MESAASSTGDHVEIAVSSAGTYRTGQDQWKLKPLVSSL